MDIGLKWLFFPENEEEKYEARKLMLLSLAYFFVIATYTLVKELKDSIFINVVGKEYIPWAKLITMVILVPAVLFYSFLVDNLRRYQLLRVYSFFYAASLFFSMIMIAHPTIGVTNTDTSPYRFFGWLFYFLIEGYSPFMVSVFWSFVNSISNPKEARNDYNLLIACSKVGGMVGASIGMGVFTLPYYFGETFTEAINHQILLGTSAFFVLLVPGIISYLIKNVPGKFLHGYEAAYQFEKQRSKKDEMQPGVFDGLKMFMQYPYIFGMFGMIFFYEVISTILNYQRLVYAQTLSSNISGVTSFLFLQVFWMHAVGLVISLIGTRTLVLLLGEKICLLLIPLSAGLVLWYFMTVYTPAALLWTFVVFRSINYAFAQPLREALYIPTVKDVKFKSKSWIDAFGSKLSKGTGSAINLVTQQVSDALFFPVNIAIFSVLTLVWTGVAAFMGNQYTRVIANNEVIGSDEEN